MSIDADLVRYFAIREQERADAVDAKLATFTDRECDAARAAAGAGYRLGVQAGQRGDFDIPHDSVIVMLVGVRGDGARQQYLAREAAVMGYVRGTMAGRGGQAAEVDDEAVFRFVVACCQSMADLYPLLGGDLRDVVQWLVFRCHLSNRMQILTAAAELGSQPAEAAADVLRGLVEDEVLVGDGINVRAFTEDDEEPEVTP